MYRFYITLEDGTEVSWRGLTLKQARDMYAFTDKRLPHNVSGFGWEEER